MPELDGPTVNITILGGGSWGTALALLLAENHHKVTIWDRDQELVASIKQHHVNPRYLTEIILPENVKAAASMREAIGPKAEWVIVAVSSNGIRDVVMEAAEYLTPQTGIISASKGLEPDTGFTMSEVISLLLQQTDYRGIVALSGPNLASEIARHTPSATVCASDDINLAHAAQEVLVAPDFLRVYTHTDVKGIEIGGAIKNVLAIAAGVSDGLGFGDNTKAALMTRGLMEMTQLGLKAGAKPLTFLGLAGVGDLMATATSKLSRNYRVGLGLAQRKSIEQVLTELHQAAEGVPTTRAAKLLAKRYAVSTPLIDAIYDLLYKGKSPVATVHDLLSRPARDEFS
jgi:glycerol-3-phosphate dehydrogenase (NAD(P)+)